MSPITHRAAVADQLAAATRHADRANRAITETGAATLTRLPAPTPWLASKLAQLRTAALDGTARSCQHLAHGPRVTFAAAWAPGLLVCAHCAPALTPDPTEETTCDKCRTHVPSIHPRAATVGPLVYAYGLCETCARTEPDGHTPNRATRRRTRT